MSGVLLHVTSLPSKYGIGDFGPKAYEFVDTLHKSKQRLWQVLPLTPTQEVYGNSPYSSYSAFAGNTFLISPELLIEQGLLESKDLKPIPKFSKDKVDFKKVIRYKRKIFNKVYQHFKNSPQSRLDFVSFCAKNKYWLDDFALFVSLKRHYSGKLWIKWPKPARDRNKAFLERMRKKFREDIQKRKFLQYLFFKQWQALKAHCHKKKVSVIGDIPIYVNLDSSDVWAHPKLFKLDKNYRPKFVAGVPPDYFSATGQLWGNPVYNWKRLKKERYGWWIKRIENNAQLFDCIRIDHFRGFASFWQIPAKDKTAMNGRWVDGPREHFFKAIKRKYPRLSIIAEDLGEITPDVPALMNKFKLPGMRVLLFSFGGDFPKSIHLPSYYIKNSVAYTGTHDNNTVRGWFSKEAGVNEKKNLEKYLRRKVTAGDVNWTFIRLVMRSKSNAAIVPMQDILGLGMSARMNTPATPTGNWGWRLKSMQWTVSLQRKLAQITKSSQRA